MSLDELAKRESLGSYQDRLSIIEGQLKKIEYQMISNHNERLRQLAIIRESISVYKQEEKLKQSIKQILVTNLILKEEANDT